jgi:hypothetical protein
MGQSMHFWYKPTNSQTSLANSISRLEARYGVLDFTYLLLCSLHTSYHSSLYMTRFRKFAPSLTSGDLRTNRSTPYSFHWQKQFLRYNLGNARLPLRQPWSLLQEEFTHCEFNDSCLTNSELSDRCCHVAHLLCAMSGRAYLRHLRSAGKLD